MGHAGGVGIGAGGVSLGAGAALATPTSCSGKVNMDSINSRKDVADGPPLSGPGGSDIELVPVCISHGLRLWIPPILLTFTCRSENLL